MNGAVGDPELIELSDGYAIFFTGHESGGRPSIGRVDIDADLEPLVDASPIQVATGESVEGHEISQPTVWQHDPATWVMIARATENGIAHLRALRSDDGGANWYHHRTSALEMLTSRDGTPTSSSFDADDIGHPSLVVYNGAWQLFYTGRRGTRSSIGVLLSDDLVNWRFHQPGVPVLAPAASDDEQVGVLAGDVVIESFGVSMVYTADDGYQQRLYSTSRRATDSGSYL
jgi:sucrose-6-phosphate hydrolase SacC (GH32 family)